MPDQLTGTTRSTERVDRTSPTPILVSGMLWSGSSALVDAISECENVATLAGEFKFYSSWVAPRYSLLKRLWSEMGASESFFQVAYDLMSSRIRVTRIPGGYYRRKLRRIRRIFAIAATPALAGVVSRRLVNWLGEATPIGSVDLLTNQLIRLTARPLRQSARWHSFDIDRFWTSSKVNAAKLLHDVAPSSQYIVLDQAVPVLAGDLPSGVPDGISFYESPCLAVVYRDPADQLTDFIRKGGSQQWSRVFDSRIARYEGSEIERFCRWQLDSLKNVRDLVAANPQRVLAVKFENLVRNFPRYRDWLSGTVGLVFPPQTGSKFRPNESARNVGIHRNYLTVKQCSTIDAYRPHFEQVWHELAQLEP